MDVAVTELRANLRDYLTRVRGGEELLITERGTPIARLSAIDSTSTLERLTSTGQIARPSLARRPVATGRTKPRSRHAVADIVSDLR